MSTRKKVLCPMERKGKTYWMRIGSAYINKDGSTNVYLDAYPANGKLQIRDMDAQDFKAKTPDSTAQTQNASADALPF
jgi:hypothetical protein